MSFSGNPRVEWVDDDREMKLLEDLIYVDSSGDIWTAKAGLIFDGASIPRFMWRVIGSPFTGKYRRAAILHDQYYQEPNGKTRKQVDKMFKHAMREDGCSVWKAQLMYNAVRMFGPDDGWSHSDRS